ncbi:hypothetical protein ACO2RV_21215 [Ancylobacter sp. VNQ12]|uniref:hypothetical protein n=1 Tax=Ancylobacter sp. VNQ12 TaxID=3400920 RepID=UPI003C02EC40
MAVLDGVGMEATVLKNLSIGLLASAILLAAPPAEADWFARLDETGTLRVMGISTDENRQSYPVYLDCIGKKLRMTIATQATVSGIDPKERSLRVSFIVTGPKEAGARRETIKLTGALVELPSFTLAAVVDLDEKQSAAMLGAIARGRIDYTLQGKDLDGAGQQRKIYAGGAIAAAGALTKYCGIPRA